ncbi:winged helix DNA-binding protein [Archangium minus]|uniref:Winged helix DNA-binding protein n=1 Tax=Archangium minus TaxID=83450 RepID=A0ABY9X8T4_9BACT|nr:winged helix DNA-binding protein [Archangium minus]
MPKPRTGDELIDTLLSTARHLRMQANDRLSACGLSLPRYKVLQLLEEERRRMREVSDALDIVPRTLTSTVDGLESEGLVKREEDPEDRRATLLSLTPQGRKRLTEARTILAAHVRERTAGFSAEERTVMMRLLKKLAGE